MSASQPHRWRRRPEKANWGDFGPDDTLGTLNYLTPETLREAAGEVRSGRVFCLSLPLDLPGGSILNPRRRPPRLSPTMRGDSPNYNYRLGQVEPDRPDVVCDDQVDLYCQYSTQWDGLAHVGSLFDSKGDGRPQTVFYNGYVAGEHVVLEGDGESGYRCSAGPLGIDGMAAKGVVGRGVLVDLRHHLGPARRRVTLADLQTVLRADRVTIEPGDILCLRTGYSELILEMGGQPDRARLGAHAIELEGRDDALLDWLTASKIAALVADNYAVEALPATAAPAPQASMPLHEHCLFKLGMPLGELWYLGELADWLRRQERHSFLLSAPPLRLPGAAGSPVTPLAMA